MNFVRIGDNVINFDNVKYFRPYSYNDAKTQIFFYQGDKGSIVVNVDFEELYAMINRSVIANG